MFRALQWVILLSVLSAGPLTADVFRVRGHGTYVAPDGATVNYRYRETIRRPSTSAYTPYYQPPYVSPNYRYAGCSNPYSSFQTNPYATAALTSLGYMAAAAYNRPLYPGLGYGSLASAYGYGYRLGYSGIYPSILGSGVFTQGGIGTQIGGSAWRSYN